MRALKRAESHCGYHLCHLIAPLVMDPNIRRLLRQLCSDGDRLFSSAHVAANKGPQLQGEKKERKEEKNTRKSKPPLCCDKIIPYKSSCTFKLQNKELLTRPRLQFDGGQMPRAPFPPNMTQWIRLVTCAFTVLEAISLPFSHSLSTATSLAPDCPHALRPPNPFTSLVPLGALGSKPQTRASAYLHKSIKSFP